MAKKYLIIGVGRFGKSVLIELHKLGHDVVAIDRDEEILESVDEHTSYVASGDARDDRTLEELNVTEFDGIVVSMGDDFEAAVLIVAKLKALGCENIMAKANDKTRGDALKAIGANQIIFPERESGTRLARKIAFPGLVEFLSINEHFSVMELSVPTSFIGKNIVEIDLRNKYKVNVLAVSRVYQEKQETYVSPGSELVFKEGDLIVVLGDNDGLKKFQKKVLSR